MLIPIAVAVAVAVVATNVVYLAAESALCPVPHHHVHFSYHIGSEDDPSHWHELDKDTHCCGGSKQSPIDIQTEAITCAKLDPIRYRPASRKQISGNLKINGHGASLAFFKSNRLVTKDIPFSDGEYVLDSMHFHSPSEHLVNGKHLDGELHLVHYKKRYGSVAAAVGKEDGLAVVGVFLEVTGESQDNAFNRFVDGVAKLKDDKPQKVSLDPRELLLLVDNYYTYKGSLTTPPCSESVRWVVMDLPVLTTKDRLNVLKNVPASDGKPLSVDTNVRAAQPLNGRHVYRVC